MQRHLLQEPREDGTRVAPTTIVDILTVGVGSAYHLVTLVALVYVLVNRNYPPFRTKSTPLLAAIGLGGVLWWMGLVAAYGSFDYPPDTPTTPLCEINSVVQWLGLSFMVNGSALRIYRSYRIFIKHDSNMLSTSTQLAIGTIPFMLSPIGVASGYSNVEFYTSTMTCIGDGTLTLIANGYILLLVIASLVMMLKLRGIRRQFNEYRELRWIIGISVCMVLFFPVLNVIVFPSSRQLGRYLIYGVNVIGNFAILWPLMYRPLKALLTHDEEYLHTFTYGFSVVPTPAMLRERLEDQLTVPELRENFKKFANKRMAEENVEFYGACLDRDEIDDYFQRLAATLQIIERFIREDAPQQVNVSNAVRKKILTTDPASFEIFDDARKDVLEMMELNLKDDFVASEDYKKISEAAAKEQEELEILEKMNLKPKEAANLLQVRSEARTTRSKEISRDKSSSSPSLSTDGPARSSDLFVTTGSKGSKGSKGIGKRKGSKGSKGSQPRATTDGAADDTAAAAGAVDV